MTPQARLLIAILLLASSGLAACQPQPISPALAMPIEQEVAPVVEEVSAEQTSSTPLPTRPPYSPGELVDYTAQSGDTLPFLALRFNTSVEEIRTANPIIPEDATTMPPGMPMKIPIYYLPLWGSPYQILPDSLFPNGPAQVDFDVRDFVASQPGWLNGYVGFAAGRNRSGAEIVEVVASNFSVSPRLLLALLEYQSGALSQPEPPPGAETYPLEKVDSRHKGLYLQQVWAANFLNNGYYDYRTGKLQTIFRKDGTIERPDPWQNAATVTLQRYFSHLYSVEDYTMAISADGLAKTYRDLFGDPWESEQPHIPGSLRQPDFVLPFEVGTIWALTGGPHTGWGSGAPLAALDFAPPSVIGGCVWTDEWVTAMAPGVVVRSEPGIVVLDLDGDGDERTGWVIFHLHIATEGRAPLGKSLGTGDPVGHPSCEAGNSTGTHVHIARKYNGEWIPAEGTLAFNLEGWIAQNGSEPYQGTLARFARIVRACTCSDGNSFITAGERPQEPELAP
ncbi:MAG TPA: LysM domain-containing protein [Anaerolineales bacterium]